MPEGHTIHRVARDHRKRYVGERLDVSSPQGRFEDGASELDGERLEEVDAVGKHLFYRWGNGKRLHIHLGLYGKFRNHRVPVPEPRGAVRLRVIGPGHAFDLNGPTACELLSDAECQKILNRLGEDPLRSDADAERVWRRISKSRAAIGKLLLDQSIIAGVGNVYRAEALFLNRLDPERAGKSLSRNEFDALWATLVDMLTIGERYNRIITADPNVIGKPRSRMNRAERLLCYKRSNCLECGDSIQKWDLGARTIYACKRCQR